MSKQKTTNKNEHFPVCLPCIWLLKRA